MGREKLLTTLTHSRTHIHSTHIRSRAASNNVHHFLLLWLRLQLPASELELGTESMYGLGMFNVRSHRSFCVQSNFINLVGDNSKILLQHTYTLPNCCHCLSSAKIFRIALKCCTEYSLCSSQTRVMCAKRFLPLSVSIANEAAAVPKDFNAKSCICTTVRKDWVCVSVSIVMRVCRKRLFSSNDVEFDGNNK